MKTIRVQIKDSKALKILKDLEDLDILRVLGSDDKDHSEKTELSNKYAGTISSDSAKKINSYVNESREEWEDRDI